MTRRTFLRASAVALAARTLTARGAVPGPPSGPAPLDLRALARFVDPLPVPRVATPLAAAVAGCQVSYHVPMRRIASRIHRDLPPTNFWSFGATFPGPTIDVRRGQATSVDWINELPARHFLPIDPTIHGAAHGVPEVRAVVHVHGAKVPSESDGHPDQWVVPGQSKRCVYPNDQDAATLWYHDHTMGINRLNVYAGLMGCYLIRDDGEDALNLPSGRYEIPLVICDRAFTAGAQLYYPTSGDPASPWVSEIFCEAILANGKLFPYLDVERRKYRFRVVNGSNARFLHLAVDGGAALRQIGSDQGLLAAPAPIHTLTLAPAERADVVLDFAAHGGAQLVLSNDGVPIVQFRVARAASEDPSVVPATLRAIAPANESRATTTRTHTIAEDLDVLARPMRMLLNGVGWHAPATEIVTLGTTEIWNLVNTTDDTHPIHLHLVRFQILDRRKFDDWVYRKEGRLVFTGPALPPEAGEAGWKDTVRADAGMVTRIAIHFEGYAGRYMWHCHVLEHGDNEMMRPLEILPAAPSGSD